MPYFVAWFEILTIAFVPIRMSVADYTNTFHLLTFSRCLHSSYEIGYEILGTLKSEERRIDAQVVRRAVAPTLASIVIVVRRACVLTAFYQLARFVGRSFKAVAHVLDAFVDVGSHEYRNHVPMLAQHVVGTTAHKYARRLGSSLAYGVALQTEQILLR